MKTILTTVYAVNPYKGSEDAMGWNYVYQIARFNKVIAITRKNNQASIEEFMKQNPDTNYSNIKFYYFDLDTNYHIWKRGMVGSMIYFYLWQKGVISFIENKQLQFDITHHLNFHNDWTPSYLWKLNKPFVWGPIGHHPLIPKQYNKTMPLKDRIENKLKWLVKKYFWNKSADLQETLDHADHIWCMNSSVEKVLDIRDKNYHVSPSVASQDLSWNEHNSSEVFNIISAGRLVHMKGFDLTLESFAKFLADHKSTKVKLTIIGDGPEKKKLVNLAETLGIKEQVVFIDWIERTKLLEIMKQGSAFLFPSHEGAGMVVPEALSFGLPIITLDNYGPGEFVKNTYGYKVTGKDYNETVSKLSQSIYELVTNKKNYNVKRKAARQAFLNDFSWNRRGETLDSIYDSIKIA